MGMLTRYRSACVPRPPLALHRFTQAPNLTRILGLLSRAEALRAGIPTRTADDSSAAHVPAIVTSEDDGHTRRRGLGRKNRTRRLGEDVDGPSASSQENEDEELSLLRQAVELQDSLGYDEPPQLPLPVRLFLGAALLRRAEAGATDAATAEAAEEAEATFASVEVMYPNMGRTLLGLSKACSTLGKETEAEEFTQRLAHSWLFSEVWLEDSAHVGGSYASSSSADAARSGGGMTTNAVSEMQQDRTQEGAAGWTNEGGSDVLAVAVVLICVSLIVFVARAILHNNRDCSFMPATVAISRRRACRGYQSVEEIGPLVGVDDRGQHCGNTDGHSDVAGKTENPTHGLSVE